MYSVLVIQNDATENLGLYQNFLQKKGAEITLLKAYELNGSFPDTNNFTHFIVGPTPISANELYKHAFLVNEWDYLSKIVRSNKPTLGVCCGGQMLAKLLGAEVVKSPKKEVGGYTVSLTNNGLTDQLFLDFPKDFPVFHWHTDMFKIPSGGKLLAKGDSCSIQAFAWQKIRGVMFHLEIDHDEVERWAVAYPSEPAAVGKTKDQVILECIERESEMRRLAEKLIINFLNMAV